MEIDRAADTLFAASLRTGGANLDLASQIVRRNKWIRGQTCKRVAPFWELLWIPKLTFNFSLAPLPGGRAGRVVLCVCVCV